MKKSILILSAVLSISGLAKAQDGGSDVGNATLLCLDALKNDLPALKRAVDKGGFLKTTKHIAKEAGNSDNSIIERGLAPVAAPLMGAIDAIFFQPEDVEDLKVTERLIGVLDGTISDKRLRKLKSSLGAGRVSDEVFVEHVMDLAANNSLCTLKESKLKASKVGMERIKAAGYNSAMEAMFDKDNNPNFWYKFKNDSSNFEVTYFGARPLDELKELFKTK